MIQTGLLVLLLVMSGGIAYLADKIGKDIGKKRLTVFGLRPRTTAKLITILIGVLISGFTFLAVLLFSSDVRHWLLEGPAIKAQLDQSQKDLKSAKEAGKVLTGTNQSLAQQNRTLSSQTAKAEQDLNAKKTQLDQIQGKIQGLQTRIEGSQARISSLRKDVATGNATIAGLNQQKAKSASDLASAKEQYKQVKAQSEFLRNDNKGIQDRNLALESRKDELQNQLNELEGQVKQTQADFAKAKTGLVETQGELTESQKNLSEAVRQLDAAKGALAAVNQQLEKAQLTAAGYELLSNASRNQPLIYKVGEEIARLPIRAGLNNAAARNEITTLIRSARVSAHKKGAGDADIQMHSENSQPITKETIERQIAAQIVNSPAEQVLIATASINSFKGEPVSLEVTVASNPHVYATGQIIAEAKIDSQKGDLMIFSELTKFLSEEVRQTALRNGMIPVVNSDVSLGEVSTAEVLQLLERIRKSGDRQVRLQALAAANTRAADTLRLKFRIR